MKRIAGYGLLLWCLLLCHSAVADSAAAWLTQARNAVGGAAWSRVSALGSHYAYQHTDDTDSGDGTEATDFIHCRFIAQVNFNPITVFSYGMENQRAWRSDLDHVELREDALAPGDHTPLYRQAYGYWFARGQLAHAVLLGQRRHAGRRYQVLRVTPADGQPFEFWINLATRRVERRVERVDDTDLVTDYGQFRRVGKLWLPFEERRSLDGQGHAVLMRRRKVVLNARTAAEAFAPPKVERIEGFDGAAVTIPFEDCETHICLQVTLNGAGPFRFLLDTGARNAMAPHVFQQLQLKNKGELAVAGVGATVEHSPSATVERTGLDRLSLRQQDFLVLSLLDQIGIDGILGYEWLQRCPILVDYAAHRLTLYAPDDFHYAGPAQATTLYLDHQSPRIDGVLDGMAGRFGFDTGSHLSLSLSKAFIDQHDLMQRYAGSNDASVDSRGIGGASNLLAGRGGVFTIGGVEIPQPPLELYLDSKGVVGGAKIAGNIGNGLLQRFRVLLDYQHQQVYLEPTVTPPADQLPR